LNESNKKVHKTSRNDEPKVVLAADRDLGRVFASSGELLSLKVSQILNLNLPQISSSKLIARKFEIKFDEKIVNVTTKLDLQANDAYSFAFHTQLLTQLDSFIVQIGIALPSASGTFETFIQNTVQDVCKYYKNRNGNMFLLLFFNSKFTSRSFPNSCPIAPGNYFMEGFEIDEKFLKIRGLETEFRILIDLCQKVNGRKLSCFVNLKFHGEVKDRKKWEKEIEQKRSDKTA
jgi:Protein of unknown function (DUF1091)